MRRYLRYVSALLIIVTTLVSCDTNKRIKYTFFLSDDGISVPYTESVSTMDYTIRYGELYVDLNTISVSATSDAAWIKSIDTSTPGVIAISVEDNMSDSERVATIHLSAPSTKSEDIRLTQLGTPPTIVEHTVIHYFFGTSLSYHFKNNIKDVSAAISEGALSSSGRYIYFMQSSRTMGHISEIHFSAADNSAVERHIQDVVIEENKPIESIVAETLRTMADLAPANRYGVIMAGHGFGWVTREMLSKDASEFSAMPYANPWVPAAGAEATRAFGENNVQADITELAAGIENSGIEFDYLLFDACFMSNIEALYDLRNAADYIIASPCEIMAMGFPYHRVLKHLYAEDGKRSDVVAAAEAYHIFYRDEYTSKNRSGSVAVIDCSELEALAEATHNMALSATTDYSKRNIQSYEGQSPHSFYDFGGWYRTVATDSAALEALEAQLERTIVARYTLSSFYTALGSYGNYPIDVEKYTGVTTSAPCKQYSDEWQQTSWYKRAIE